MGAGGESVWDLGDGRRLDLGARVQIMGVLNVTPDSFYDGGRLRDTSAAVSRAMDMVAEGADIIDIGGESSRPPLYGEALEVDVAEELHRVIPVIEQIRQRGDVAISIDTTKAEVASSALEAGADIVNDISSLDDPDMGRVVADCGSHLILMHRRGSPATMQLDTYYDDLLAEIDAFLSDRLERAYQYGIRAERIAVDPGLGFGKTMAGNLMLIRHLSDLASLGHPLVVGASRKSFIWKQSGTGPDEALAGSLAAAVMAVVNGARLIRVHDVAETVQAVRLAEAIQATELMSPAPM